MVKSMGANARMIRAPRPRPLARPVPPPAAPSAPAAIAPKAIVARIEKTPPMIESRESESRAYKDADLEAIAEMGYHYLFSGGHRLAAAIFDGLAAIRPNVAYYFLGRGLAADHLGDRERALSCYGRAAELDPSDGRADINLAELELEAGRRDRAIDLLKRGHNKSKRRGDQALEKKAHALLGLVLEAR